MDEKRPLGFALFPWDTIEEENRTAKPSDITAKDRAWIAESLDVELEEEEYKIPKVKRYPKREELTRPDRREVVVGKINRKDEVADEQGRNGSEGNNRSNDSKDGG